MSKSHELEHSDQEFPDPEERRKFERAEIEVRVDYSTVDSFFTQFTRDINEGGLFIETNEPHPADTVVSLKFELPDRGEPIHVQGRVAWIQTEGQSGMGIKFENLDSGSRARINRLVRELRSTVGPADG